VLVKEATFPESILQSRTRIKSFKMENRTEAERGWRSGEKWTKVWPAVGFVVRGQRPWGKGREEKRRGRFVVAAGRERRRGKERRTGRTVQPAGRKGKEAQESRAACGSSLIRLKGRF